MHGCVPLHFLLLCLCPEWGLSRLLLHATLCLLLLGSPSGRQGEGGLVAHELMLMAVGL